MKTHNGLAKRSTRPHLLERHGSNTYIVRQNRQGPQYRSVRNKQNVQGAWRSVLL
jgi:hypothetical protein